MPCFTPIEELGDLGGYLYGLYFLVSLITTIAYGDIIGKNPLEEVLQTSIPRYLPPNADLRHLPYDPLHHFHRYDPGAVHDARPR